MGVQGSGKPLVVSRQHFPASPESSLSLPELHRAVEQHSESTSGTPQFKKDVFSTGLQHASVSTHRTPEQHISFSEESVALKAGVQTSPEALAGRQHFPASPEALLSSPKLHRAVEQHSKSSVSAQLKADVFSTGLQHSSLDP